ncbi:MAG: hypothetical protein PHE61_08335, partial [Candidatus Omnitrophica bacterium]|nr:hypothetical protein [Candidatus Omnitrophota bacterium]
HDVGHAFILEHLGFFPPNYIFHELQRYLIGMHYHDVLKMKDHQVPLSGDVDFPYFKPWLLTKKDIVEVIEAHPPAKGEDIVSGAEKLERAIYS